MQKINIALCTDDNFVIPAIVCLTSILEHNQCLSCSCYVLTDGLSEESNSKFKQLSKVYHQSIEIINVNGSRFSRMRTRGRYRTSMYYRFLLPELLRDASNVLYLDCDVMCRKTLDALLSIDLKDKACAVIPDQECDDTLMLNRLHLQNIYFNSGVMFMNLDYWRDNKIADRLISFIEENPSLCHFPDQDALNKILDGKVVYLPYRYNYQERWYTERNQIRIHYSKWADLDNEGKDPTIVHFCVTEKPWFVECKNPWKEEYLKYGYMFDFVNFKVKKRYSFKHQLLKCLKNSMKSLL